MTISSDKMKQIIYQIAMNDSQEDFKAFYLAYYSKLFNLANYYIKSEQSAEEIVSDTFYAIWEQRAKLLEVHHLNAYICQMVRNISISYIRRNSGKENTDLFEAIDPHTSSNTDENPESELISMELMDLLNHAIDNLPDRCKLVFKLVREEHLKYKDVAQMLNLSIKTIEAHMSLAIKRLREVIEKNMG